MNKTKIPNLSAGELKSYLKLAKHSKRRRSPKILHRFGAKLNRVFNFMMHDSYMQPHLHPGEEKTEWITIVKGKIAILFFNDHGNVNSYRLLSTNGKQIIKVPPFTWHTYVILSKHAITYETMKGVYNAKTWKTMPWWAPPENSPKKYLYLNKLKNSNILSPKNTCKKT